jgi:cobalt-zinc-cadmium resistance protein CzcA
MEQRAQVAEAEWKLQRSQWAPEPARRRLLPDLRWQRTLQRLPHRRYPIPLPGSGQGGRTKAARLRSEIAAQELEAARRQRSSERASTQAQLAQLRESLDYFESTGAALAANLRDDALRAYRAGEADYFQFTQGIEQAFQLNAEHLRVRYELALTVLHLRALQGL